MDKKRKFSKKALRDFELIDAAIKFNDQNDFKFRYGDSPLDLNSTYFSAP